MVGVRSLLDATRPPSSDPSRPAEQRLEGPGRGDRWAGAGVRGAQQAGVQLGLSLTLALDPSGS